MSEKALGLIETVGLAAAIEAADTCMKSANVELIGYELTKGFGMVTVKIEGDVSAVKVAIECAKIKAATVNTVYASLVIPRPAKKLEIMMTPSKVVDSRNKLNEENKYKMVEKIIEEVQQEIVEEEVTKQEVIDKQFCNICYDPKCKRKKGMPRKMCLHYKSSEGDKV